MDVLVLNKNYQAISIATFKRAILMLFNNRAEVIDFSNNSFNSYSFESWAAISNNLERTAFTFGENKKLALPPAVRVLEYGKTFTRNIRAINKNIFLQKTLENNNILNFTNNSYIFTGYEDRLISINSKLKQLYK
jgi:hypothetical protein